LLSTTSYIYFAPNPKNSAGCGPVNGNLLSDGSNLNNLLACWPTSLESKFCTFYLWKFPNLPNMS